MFNLVKAMKVWVTGTLRMGKFAELVVEKADGSEARIAAEELVALDPESRLVTVTDDAMTLTQKDHGGRTILLDRAAGVTVTLPEATGSGERYKIVTLTTVTSNANIIQAESADDSFVGQATGVDTDGEGATGYTWNADDGDDTITMDGDAQGGVAGDVWEIEDIDDGVFLVNGRITQSGGAEATPFSAAVA